MRLFGAKIDHNVKVFPSTKISQPWNLEIASGSIISWRSILYCLGQVYIGRNVLISQGVHLCAGSHDISKVNLPLIKEEIYIDDFSWIASEAFIGPGVRIGKYSVVGARSVIMNNVNDHQIKVGNPARLIGYRK